MPTSTKQQATTPTPRKRKTLRLEAPGNPPLSCSQRLLPMVDCAKITQAGHWHRESGIACPAAEYRECRARRDNARLLQHRAPGPGTLGRQQNTTMLFTDLACSAVRLAAASEQSPSPAEEKREINPPTPQLEHQLQKVIAFPMYRNAFRLKRRSVLLTTGVAWSFV